MRPVRSGQREQPLWRRTRPNGLAPVALIVAVAVACIVFAVFSSAHRADVVALDHERQLFSHALSARQARILAEVEYIASSNEAFERLWVRRDQAWIDRQIGMRLKKRLAHSVVLLADAKSGSIHTLIAAREPNGTPNGPSVLRDLAPVLAAPAGRSGRGVARTAKPRGAAAVVAFQGRPAMMAAAPLAIPAERRGGTTVSPALVMVTFIVQPLLDRIGARLKLPHLRLVDAAPARNTDNGLVLTSPSGRTVARFAWTPNRPGAEIVQSILPFVCITVGCFILLTAFVLRYMRRTTATIAAGEDRMRHMAMHDPLSGLPNRTMFGERLETLLASVKNGGRPAAVLSIDLDHFKNVNDTLGHHIGDGLIGAVAQRLGRIVRDGDTVARLGGDEFAVLASGSTEHAALEEMGDRIINALSAPYVISGHTLVIGASIGMAVVDGHSHDAADILRFADMALYRAKNGGRNRTCIYDAAMDADLTQRKQLENDLREAIWRNGLAVAYQPLVSPDGERVIGVEALCRWPHPQRGDVPPAQFIPVAEQSELIIPLGEWVLRQACLEGRSWPGITVAVNVSPLQFRRPDFVQIVERILEETGFDCTRLELELTESTLLGNVEGAANAMRQLKALGVKLALDDFGTGYSSLLYLRKFPFDKLKIDHSFVSSIETAPDAAAIVHAIVGLGRGLRMKVTAEGVENAEQQLFLRAAGVHSMQGFRFGRPAPAAEISARLARQGDAAPVPLKRLAS